MQDTPFKIYNASAGSGKTYTLTKEYLKIALASHHNFPSILAITFTNKAVNEMKSRILDSLYHFSQDPVPEKSKTMFKALLDELKLTPDTLREKSKLTLKRILHNYAFFDVSTIDKFTHRLIRTFAKDLKLPQNFEPVVDTTLLREEAVARVIRKAGSDELLTKVLIDFALQKTDEDRSWDIAFDLNEIGKLLFNENHIPHLDKIKGKTLQDFIALKKTIGTRLLAAENKIVSNAAEALQIISDNRLEFTDFSRSFFPKFMLKISQGDLQIDFDAGWKRNFDTEPLYTKTCPEATKLVLDGLQPQFVELFNGIKAVHPTYLFLRNAYQNVEPLTVLNAIQKEIDTLGKEQDQVPLFKFNQIISSEIKNQPAPFIYERLGEKYRHYFIDEFQDTSEMQWSNLLPLIDNALSSLDASGKSGSLFLVGDAKQAIYRWRGGNAEQFLDLVNQEVAPFTVTPDTGRLPVNYRSHEEIIKFNNAFFQSLLPFLDRASYQALFEEGNRQGYNSKKGGFVQLSFIEKEGEDLQNDEHYCQKTLNIIQEVIGKDYRYNDICILVRSNSKGVLLANYLVQYNIPIISSESLLLESSERVRFLINLLRYGSGTEEDELAFELLSFLAENSNNKHAFISVNINNIKSLFQQEYGFSLDSSKQRSAYDTLELAIRSFDLAPKSDAYITFLLDLALEIEHKFGGNTQTFLEQWDIKKDKLAVIAPDNVDAVRIMTVHKAKGLEFPIVIFPFANMEIYRRIDKKMWLPVNSEDYNGFEELLVNEKSELVDYGTMAKALFEEEEQKMALDAFNVLYVALTRAEKALYVVTQNGVTRDGGYNTKLYSGLFIHYLKEIGQWRDGQGTYEFGTLENNIEYIHQQDNGKYIDHHYSHKDRASFKIVTRSGVLWDTQREDALLRGNLIHHILGLIETEKDIDAAFTILVQSGTIAQEEISELRSRIFDVVRHPKLNPFYTEGNRVLNEKDILTRTGEVLRPDRVVLNKDRATIIDYKTGLRSPSHHHQVYTYATALETMGYIVENKIIVYINKSITPEFI